jgi:hypothetical protein
MSLWRGCRLRDTLTAMLAARTLAAHQLIVADPLYRRMLSRASDLLGGHEALAQHLGVTTTRLMLWSVGAEALPPSVFLKLVDLLLQAAGGSRTADDHAQAGALDSAERAEQRPLP